MMFPLAAWIRYALLGFLSFGATNFLLGCIGEWSGHDPAASISAPIVVWLGMGLAGALATLSFTVSGRGFRGIPAPRLVWIAAVAGVTLSLGMLTLKLGLAAAPQARGPIVSITSANSMLVAWLSLFLLRERLSRVQALGFAVIIVGVATVGLASGLTASVVGVAFGLATMLLFGVTNFLLKYAGHHGMDSVTGTALLWIASGGCGVAAASLWGLGGLGTPGLRLAALLAGGFLALGMLGIKLAVTKGPAGPATAITGSNAILVTLLDLLVFGRWPPAGKVVGMLLALAGIAILTAGGPGVGGDTTPKRHLEG